MGEVLLSIVLGLLVNEITNFSPWVARKTVRWAARHWTKDDELVNIYEEEWSALVNERPGNLFKVFTAFWFASGAAVRIVVREKRQRRSSRILRRQQLVQDGAQERRPYVRHYKRRPRYSRPAGLIGPFMAMLGLLSVLGLPIVLFVPVAIVWSFVVVSLWAPTRCGVPTRSGQPCRYATRGFIFGCHYHRYTRVLSLTTRVRVRVRR
jgi:hypothetical protein